MSSRLSKRGPSAARRAGVTFVAAVALAGSACFNPGPPRHKGDEPGAEPLLVKPIAFDQRNEKNGDVYNTSGIVALEDGRFLAVDNNTNDALLELRIDAAGKQAAPLKLIPLAGLSEDAVDDIEDLALAEAGGRRFVICVPSLSLKAGSKKKGKEEKVRPSSLIRAEVMPDGRLRAEEMPDFRDWLIRSSPELGIAERNLPDLGGLNVEGAAWDPTRNALLLGIRTPALSSMPIVVPIRIRDVAGPWTAANLEALPSITLRVERARDRQGIRGMATLPDGKGFLVTVGNATSQDEAPFATYVWDGDKSGTVRRLPIVFSEKMKPEGLCYGTVGGKPAIVFVDDDGGFKVVMLDELPPDSLELRK